jgi:hypothetical protein
MQKLFFFNLPCILANLSTTVALPQGSSRCFGIKKSLKKSLSGRDQSWLRSHAVVVSVGRVSSSPDASRFHPAAQVEISYEQNYIVLYNVPMAGDDFCPGTKKFVPFIYSLYCSISTLSFDGEISHFSQLVDVASEESSVHLPRQNGHC